MIAKAGLGIIGLGAISVGGVALANPGWLGMSKEIIWKPLSQDKDFATKSGDSGAYHNKFGSDFKNYLVGLDAGSKGWWEESYKKLVEDKVSSGNFDVTSANKKVNSYFDGEEASGSGKPLKQVCEDAYKADPTNVKSSPDTNKTAEFDEAQVWKYCSPVGKAPKKVNENSGEEGTYSADNSSAIGKSKASELLSIGHKDNEELWKLKNDEFFGLGVFKAGTSKAAPTEKFFEALFNKNESKKDPYALKNKCEAAYKLVSDSTNASTDASKTKEEDVVKYCSLKSINQ